jgi:hypothetical protein
MVYQGVVPPNASIEGLNSIRFDIKRALRISQGEVSQLISDLSDQTKTKLIIDGRVIDKTDTLTLGIAVNAKMERLQNQTSTMINVFTELFRIEKSIGSSGA